MLALLQPFQHCPRHIFALLTQYFQIFLHRIKLRLQDALLQLRTLRYLPELVVAHDNAVVVVVPDVVEETHAVGGREILFRSIQDAGVRIGGLIGGCNLRHIRLQADNHRLVRQFQPLHFICCNAHYQRFTGSNLVVADPAAVLFQHPYAVLLRGIYALDSPACQPFEIEVGKGLVASVILRAHETVELAVIHRHEPLLELRRLLFQPFGEPTPDFVNLGVGELYALAVAHLDVVAVFVLADGLHHVRAGVVQGVLQQVHAVVVAVIALYQKLVRDFHGTVAASHRELVHAGGIGDFHVRFKQVAHIRGVHARGNPSFTEVEVEVFKLNPLRFGFFQCFQCLLHFRHMFIFGIGIYPIFDSFRLLYHVSGDEPVLDLVTGYERVVEDAPFQGLEQFLLRSVGYLPHIIEIDRSESVERCCKRFLRCPGIHGGLHPEGYGAFKDVRLHKPAALRTFQRKDIASAGIHHHQFHILLGIEVAVAHDKFIVAGVQVFTPLGICLVSVRFIAVQPLVCVTD